MLCHCPAGRSRPGGAARGAPGGLSPGGPGGGGLRFRGALRLAGPAPVLRPRRRELGRHVRCSDRGSRSRADVEGGWPGCRSRTYARWSQIMWAAGACLPAPRQLEHTRPPRDQKGSWGVRPSPSCGATAPGSPQRPDLGWSRLPESGSRSRDGPGGGGGEKAPKMAPAPPRRRPAGEGRRGRAAAPPPRLALLPGAGRCRAAPWGGLPAGGGGGGRAPAGGDGAGEPHALACSPQLRAGREFAKVGVLGLAGASRFRAAGGRVRWRPKYGWAGKWPPGLRAMGRLGGLAFRVGV